MRADRRARQLLKALLLVVLAGEGLHDRHAGQRLVDVGLDAALDVAPGVRRLANRPAEHPRRRRS